MRVLITGMNGFAGNALAEFLLRETHWMLIGVSSSTDGERINARVQWWKLDLRNPDGVRRLIKYERPDLIFHLAAQASVPRAWENAWETYEVNVRGTLNLFEAVIANKTTPRILVVSSNEVYGAPADASELPFTEGHPLRPNNPYGVSKVAQETLALQYRNSHGLDVLVVRPFNHIGPGQRENYAISGLARKIAEIEAGLCEPVMGVGNMQAQRDFTDVRDIVRAYYKAVRLADGGSLYNVCSGAPRSIQTIFDQMLTMSDAHIEVQTDPSKFRIVDTPISYGDHTHLSQETGWQPEIPLEQTLADVLAHWRQRVREETKGSNNSDKQAASHA
jgi:GDP-4-dehydro-6-deoxy-D-mannose reductase